MVFMGKRIDITDGRATQSGFSYSIEVKAMLKKMSAQVQGTRDGDSISGTVVSPMGTFDFTGARR